MAAVKLRRLQVVFWLRVSQLAERRIRTAYDKLVDAEQ